MDKVVWIEDAKEKVMKGKIVKDTDLGIEIEVLGRTKPTFIGKISIVKIIRGDE